MLALLLSFASAEVHDTPTYELDSSGSRLYVLVRYDRSAMVPGHDHVIAANRFTGSVTWDPEAPSSCAIHIAFPVAALTVDPGDARRWEKLDGETSVGDKESITRNMLGKHQLESSLFPEIRFESTGCVRSGDGIDVSGDLTIHGVSAPVTARMTIDADGDTFAARGRFTASHGDWGMKPFTALLGSLRNDDALSFVVDVRGHRR